MPALGGWRKPGGVSAGPGMVEAARRGAVPALGGCRPPGGGCAGPGRVEAARRELCRPWQGVGPTRMLVLIGPLLLEHNYEIQYYHVHALCQINVAIIVHIYTIKLGTPALAIGLVERCKGIER